MPRSSEQLAERAQRLNHRHSLAEDVLLADLEGTAGSGELPLDLVVPFLHRPMGYVGESMRATNAAAVR